MRRNHGVRRRLAPLLDNGRRRLELAQALLMSLPGSPVVYYGDEIGMGDNVKLGDRDGVRTPMQWSDDVNGGFSSAASHQPLVSTPDRWHGVRISIPQRRSAQENDPTFPLDVDQAARSHLAAGIGPSVEGRSNFCGATIAACSHLRAGGKTRRSSWSRTWRPPCSEPRSTCPRRPPASRWSTSSIVRHFRRSSRTLPAPCGTSCVPLAAAHEVIVRPARRRVEASSQIAR